MAPQYTFIFLHHHIILDGWGIDVLFRYIHDTYISLIRGNKINVYPDNSFERCQKYLSDHLNDDTEFWQDKFATVEQLDELEGLAGHTINYTELTDIQSNEEYMLSLSTNIYKDLTDTAKVTNISLNCFFLFSWHKLLSLFTGQDKTVVGTIISGRNIDCTGIDTAVGLFVNRLPLLVDWSDLTTANDALYALQNSILEMNNKFRANQADIDAVASCRHSYTFQEAKDFIWHKGFLISNLKKIYNLEFPINLEVIHNDKNIDIVFRFNKAIFSFTRIKYIATYLIHILSKINIHSLSSAHIEFNHLIPSDYKNLTSNYVHNPRVMPDRTIHELFEEQVDKTPYNLAISFEDIELTYQELNYQANRLARYLQKKYLIKEGDLIPLIVDRSHFLVITILAVLKVGSAYVPIDPSLPHERVKTILEETSSKVLLTNQKYIESYSKLFTNYLAIDDIELKQKLLNLDFSNLGIITRPTSLVYVMYTSGTTGHPKGVMLEHKGCGNRILQMISHVNDGICKKVLFKTNYIFDVSFSDIFVALLSGSSLYITRSIFDINEIYNKISELAIDICHFTPSQFEAIKKVYGTIIFNRLRYIYFSGEALNHELLTGINTSVKCINYYGPTEAGEATVEVINRNYNYADKITIGKPFDNVRILIVDKNLRLVPLGVIGELYISGICLARGYLNHPELTMSKFIPNTIMPLTEEKNQQNNRLYKTGDLARILPNGNIEYIGRNDFQLKIAGIRVEPGEIENSIKEFPGITQCHVSTLDRLSADYKVNLLIAYFTADSSVDEQLLFDHLSKKLPEYMIPQSLIQLDKFPLTNNGKLDYKNLPLPKLRKIDERIPPANDSERLICEAFSKVLNIGNICVCSDFFKSGGNSISAIALTAILQSKFNVNLADIFKWRTPRKLAEHLIFEGYSSLIKNLQAIRDDYEKRQRNHLINTTKLAQDGANSYVENIKNLNLDLRITKPIKNVLLTGSTGFLGCNILHQLINCTSYNIYLLIRPQQGIDMLERIEDTYAYYFNQALNSYIGVRIHVLAADIEKPNFNLSKDQLTELAKDIDSVIHCAALVKHYGEAEKFYSANVIATKNMLEFTKMTNLKDFHYISTYAVLQYDDSTHSPGIFTEDSCSMVTDNCKNIYVQTKIQGEQEVIRYRENGIIANIYRVGNLAFMSTNYRPQKNVEDNAFAYWLKGLLQLKCITADLALVEISPVDLTADAIVRLFDKTQLQNNNYHVFNPYTFNITSYLKDIDLPLSIVSFREFIDHIISSLNSTDNQELILRFLLRQGWLDGWNMGTLESLNILQAKTQHILSQVGFTWPSIDTKVFKQYLFNLI